MDRSWFLLQDIDSTFTVLYAADVVIDRVLAYPIVEAIRQQQ